MPIVIRQAPIKPPTPNIMPNMPSPNIMPNMPNMPIAYYAYYPHQA